MAKDGTNRGGRRVRSGFSPRPLAERVERGEDAYVMDFSDYDFSLPDSIDLEGSWMPEPSDYLSAEQYDGKPFGADAAYRAVYRWLHERKCDHLVFPFQVELYAEAIARHRQCSEAVSTYGPLGKHPTTGAPGASPFIKMSQDFAKQAAARWYDIFEIVKQNSMTAFEGDPQGDAMEAMLRARGE